MTITTPQRAPATKARYSVTAMAVVALLAGALLALGLAPLAMPDSYSWVQHGTSESAAQGIDGAWVARSGFMLFGLAVLLVLALRSSIWGPAASFCHLCFGVSMFAVAAFSARPWLENAAYVESEDVLHSVFATVMGFGFVAGLATLIVLRRKRTLGDAMPDLAAFAVTAIIPLFMDLSIWGLLQRVMFVTAALWYGREALAGTNQPTARRRSANARLRRSRGDRSRRAGP